jgi:hypothetical protein
VANQVLLVIRLLRARGDPRQVWRRDNPRTEKRTAPTAAKYETMPQARPKFVGPKCADTIAGYGAGPYQQHVLMIRCKMQIRPTVSVNSAP